MAAGGSGVAAESPVGGGLDDPDLHSDDGAATRLIGREAATPQGERSVAGRGGHGAGLAVEREPTRLQGRLVGGVPP